MHARTVGADGPGVVRCVYNSSASAEHGRGIDDHLSAGAATRKVDQRVLIHQIGTQIRVHKSQ